MNASTRAPADGRTTDPPQPTQRTQEIESLIRDFARIATAIEARPLYAVDVAGEVGEHGLRPYEGRLGVDHPALLADTDLTTAFRTADRGRTTLSAFINRISA
jgi:hypothetical protein